MNRFVTDGGEQEVTWILTELYTCSSSSLLLITWNPQYEFRRNFIQARNNTQGLGRAPTHRLAATGTRISDLLAHSSESVSAIFLTHIPCHYMHNTDFTNIR